MQKLIHIGLLMLVASTVFAQNYQIDWYVIGSGGGTSQSASYQLSGTIGQPDAATLSGGRYQLEGGFWNETSGATLPQRVYLPLTTKP